MSHSVEEQLRQHIAHLEAENCRLKDSLGFVTAERKKLRDQLYGAVKEEDIPTEEQLLEKMKNRINGRKAFEELGVLPASPRPS
jgi:hypothetical protein